MTQANLAAAVIALSFAVVILLLVRRQRLGSWQILWWLAAACGMAVLGLFPSVADWAGERLGIHYPPVLPIVVALCLLFVKVLTMDLERTRQERRLRILAQKLAGVEARLHDLEHPSPGDSDRDGLT
jgi:hypothetical protein